MSSKEKKVLTEVEPDASSTVSEEGSTGMKKLLKAIALIFGIYEVNSRNVVMKDELSAGGNINENVEFRTLDFSRNVRRNWNANSSELNVFTAENMKDMPEMLKNVMKPSACGHVFCSSLWFCLWYKALISQFTEERTSIASDPAHKGAKDKEGRTLEKLSMFEIDTSALYYTRDIGSYRQTTVAKQAGYISFMERAIHLWQSVAPSAELPGHIDYRGHGKVPTNYPWWTGLMYIIPQVPSN